MENLTIDLEDVFIWKFLQHIIFTLSVWLLFIQKSLQFILGQIELAEIDVWCPIVADFVISANVISLIYIVTKVELCCIIFKFPQCGTNKWNILSLFS